MGREMDGMISGMDGMETWGRDGMDKVGREMDGMRSWMDGIDI